MKIERRSVEMQEKLFDKAIEIYNKFVVESREDFNFGANCVRFCLSLFISNLSDDGDRQNALQILHKAMQLDLKFIDEYKLESEKDEA